MSKWTLEKILACEEIKFGTMMKLNYAECVVIGHSENSLYYIPKGHYSACYLEPFDSVNFYQHDGTLIEPPKDKKKIKVEFWVNVYANGVYITHETKESANSNATKHRIACEYFEREVEVKDE